MAELKTKKNSGDVLKFLNDLKDESRREDSFRLLKIMREVTGEKPVMWGTSIVGFGTYTYINSAGKENEWMATGFSPRKQALTVYIMPGYELMDELLKKLGKHSTGKSCLYIKRLADVDEKVLKKLIKQGFKKINGKLVKY